MSTDLKFDEILEDIDIEILVRTGKTDFRTLTKLSQAILATVIELVASGVVLTESDTRVNIQGLKKLIILKNVLKI